MRPVDKEDVISGAIGYLYSSLDKIILPTYLPTFYSSCWKLACSIVTKSYRREVMQVFDDSVTYLKTRPHTPTPRMTLAKIFLEELPSQIIKKVTARFRFTGNELKVCSFILFKLLDGKEVSTKVLSKMFNVNAEFLRDYVMVLLISTLHNIRSDFSIEDLKLYPDTLEYTIEAYASYNQQSEPEDSIA